MAQFELDDSQTNQARIKVVGVGGGGGNAINTMIAANLESIEFIAANTDAQVLLANFAPTKLQLGSELTRGLGAGGNPEVGRKAALEEREAIAQLVADCDMIFVTAGMGGGTGTGAAPIVAQIAREAGILTVGVVTRPFTFEGRRRTRQADEGISELSHAVDCLLVIPNQKLLQVAGQRMAFTDAFGIADEVLLNAVRGICDIITVPGLINVDFADVRTIMTNKGRALMGTGRAVGEHRAVEAATQALSSPLLEDVSIEGATGILVNISGGPDMTLNEVAEATGLITQAAHEDAQCIFGSVCNSSISDEVHVTVIATGFDQLIERPAGPPPVRRPQMQFTLDNTMELASAEPLPPPPRPPQVRETAPHSPARPAMQFSPTQPSEDMGLLDTPTYLRRGTNE